MKIVLYDDFEPGLLVGDGVFPFGDLIAPNIRPQDRMLTILSEWNDLRPELESGWRSAPAIPISKVRLRAPIPKPGKIMCLASNYVREKEARPRPINAFLASPEAVADPGSTFTLPNENFRVCQHQAQVVCVFGRTGRKIDPDHALDYLFGYTCGADVCPRRDDWRYFAKSFDGTKPIGPCITTADELPMPNNLHVLLTVNNEIRQSYSLADAGYSVEECISWFSRFVTVVPGDLLFLGTPHRQLGSLRHRDRVVIRVAEIGDLNFEIYDPLERTWEELS